MKKINISHLFTSVVLLVSLCSNIAFAQSDSTNLPGLSATHVTPTNSSLGSGVPDPNQLDAVTTTTETQVQACPAGYYPNGPVPADGTDVAGQTVQGGVVYDQTVTTNRYGTTTYGGWTMVNFLCTQIPPAPTCPSGLTEVSAPYWDSTTNQWVGIVCTNPVTTATQQAACGSASYTYNGQMTATNSMNNIYTPITNDLNVFAEYYYCWGGTVRATGNTPGYTNTIYDTFSYEVGVGTDPYGYGQRQATGGFMCWVQPGTNNVVAKVSLTTTRNPGTCH